MQVAKMKELRHAKSFTQEELAKRIGVSRGLISLVELGTIQPYPSLKKRIARALGVRVVEIWPSE